MGNSVPGALETYQDTGDISLGVADLLFGEEADNPNDINQDKSLSGAGVTTSQGEQTTNTSQGTVGTVDVNTSGLTTTDNITSNQGLQSQTGETGVGAFTGQTDLGTSGYDPVTGQFTGQLSDPLQQNVDSALTSSNNLYDQLNNFNFNDTMGQRYNALEALQEQDRLQANMAMEDRLFSQGRLGSTGGALQQNALLDAIAQQQAGNLNTAFGQTVGLQTLYGDQATQFGTNALNPLTLQTQQLTGLGALAPQISQNDITTNNLSTSAGSQDTTGYSGTTLDNTVTSSSNTLTDQITEELMQKDETIRSL